MSQRRVGVEDDRRLLVDGGAGGQARLGLDGVLDVALADAAAVVRRQEAVEDAGRGLAGGRVERGERRGQQAGLDVEVEVDLHVQRRAVGVLVGDGGLVLRQPGGDGDVDRPEAERAELERGPVEVGVELLGDGDVLGGGAAVVLESMVYGKVPAGWMKPCVP